MPNSQINLLVQYVYAGGFVIVKIPQVSAPSKALIFKRYHNKYDFARFCKRKISMNLAISEFSPKKLRIFHELSYSCRKDVRVLQNCLQGKDHFLKLFKNIFYKFKTWEKGGFWMQMIILKLWAHLYGLQSSASCFSTAFKNLTFGMHFFWCFAEIYALGGPIFITTLFIVCFSIQNLILSILRGICTNCTLFANPSKYCNDDIGDVTAHRWIFVANVNVTYYLHLQYTAGQLLMFGGHLFDFMLDFREMLELWISTCRSKWITKYLYIL